MKWTGFDDPAKEIKRFEDALKNDPNDANAYYQLGTAYADLADYDKALDYCRKATALEPKNTTFIAFYSFVCTETEDHEEAIDALIELMELGADETDFCFDIAREAQSGMDEEYAVLKMYDLRAVGRNLVADKLEKWLVKPCGRN